MAYSFIKDILQKFGWNMVYRGQQRWHYLCLRAGHRHAMTRLPDMLDMDLLLLEDNELSSPITSQLVRDKQSHPTHPCFLNPWMTGQNKLCDFMQSQIWNSRIPNFNAILHVWIFLMFIEADMAGDPN